MSEPTPPHRAEPHAANTVFKKNGSDFAYGRVHGRLAQFKSWGNQDKDWDTRWSQRPLENFLAPYASGALGELEIFTRHLPKDGRILEAGCGQGQLVLALDARGYDVEGVDFAEPTLQAVKQAAPHLKLRLDDVYALSVPDGTYDGYISMGVFEHEIESPRRGLDETRRVLKEGGIACIALPYLNRERASWLSSVPDVAPGDGLLGYDFYQYYYSETEFRRHLDEAGFELIEMYYYGLYSGVTRDFVLGRHLNRKGFYVYRLHQLVSKACRVAPQMIKRGWGHVAMYICRARSAG